MSFFSLKQFNYFIAVSIACVVILAQANPLNATDMLTREQIVEIVHRQANAWENSDAEAIAADFADDADFAYDADWQEK